MISKELNNFLMEYTFPFKKLDHNIYNEIISYIGRYSNNSFDIMDYCRNYQNKKETYYLKLEYIQFLISKSKFNIPQEVLLNIFSFVQFKKYKYESLLEDVEKFHLEKQQKISRCVLQNKYIHFLIDELPIQLNKNVFSIVFSFLPEFNGRELCDLTSDAYFFESERLELLNPTKYYSSDEDENYYFEKDEHYYFSDEFSVQDEEEKEYFSDENEYF